MAADPVSPEVAPMTVMRLLLRVRKYSKRFPRAWKRGQKRQDREPAGLRHLH